MRKRILAATLGLVLLAGATACSDSGEPASLPVNPGPVTTGTTTQTPEPTPQPTATPTSTGSPSTGPSTPHTSNTTTTTKTTPPTSTPTPTFSSTPTNPPPSNNAAACHEVEAAVLAFFFTIAVPAGMLDDPESTEADRQLAIGMMVGAVNSFRNSLSQAAAKADAQLAAKINQFRSTTNGWAAAFGTGDPAVVEAAMNDPAVEAAAEALGAMCQVDMEP